MFDALQDAIVNSEEQKAFRTLNEWNGLVDFSDRLPEEPIPSLQARRMTDALPDHIEARIDELVSSAATRIDINASKVHNQVTQNTIDSYRAGHGAT